MSLRGTVTDAVAETGFGVGWSAVRALPEPAARRMFDVIADRTWARQGQGVRQLRANVARVLPAHELDRLDEVAHEGVRRYMRYWCEVFRLPSYSRQEILDAFHIDGREHMDAYLRQGRGVIMAVPHMGNWDLAAGWAALEYDSVVTVVEHLKPEGLFEKFLEFRRSLGMEVYPLGDPDIVRNLARRLETGSLVCLLTDRDLSGSGIEVSFFGERATFPAGPGMLSLMTGAPVIPAGIWHTDSGLQARVDTPLFAPEEGGRRERVAALTRDMAANFERHIAAHPQDWHMMQPFWSVDRGEAR